MAREYSLTEIRETIAHMRQRVQSGACVSHIAVTRLSLSMSEQLLAMVEQLRQSLAKAHAAASAAGVQLRAVQGALTEAHEEVTRTQARAWTAERELERARGREEQANHCRNLADGAMERARAERDELSALVTRCLAKMPEGMEHGGCLETAVDLLRSRSGPDVAPWSSDIPAPHGDMLVRAASWYALMKWRPEYGHWTTNQFPADGQVGAQLHNYTNAHTVETLSECPWLEYSRIVLPEDEQEPVPANGASHGSGEFSVPWVGQDKAMPVQTCSTCTRWQDRQCWFVPDKPHAVYGTHSCKEWTDNPLDDPRMDGVQWFCSMDLPESYILAWPFWEVHNLDHPVCTLGNAVILQWRPAFVRPLRLPGMNERGEIAAKDMTVEHFVRVAEWQWRLDGEWQRMDTMGPNDDRETAWLLHNQGLWAKLGTWRPACFAKLDHPA